MGVRDPDKLDRIEITLTTLQLKGIIHYPYIYILYMCLYMDDELIEGLLLEMCNPAGWYIQHNNLSVCVFVPLWELPFHVWVVVDPRANTN